MKTTRTIFLILMGLSLNQVLVGQFVTDHNAIFQGDLAQPQKGVLTTDPNFHTPLLRLTDARSSEIHGLAPDYSKRLAWNCDESFLLLRSGWGDAYLFNGGNYQFVKALNGVAGDDVFWHPSDPQKLYYSIDSALYSYNVVTDLVTEVHLFTPYNFANTCGEGNLSNDGRYYALAERYYNYTTGEVTYHDLTVYDIREDKIVSTVNLPQEQLSDFDWVSISPLGNYVVVDYASWETGRYHGMEVYDRNFNFIWQKGLGPGHSDMGLDASGKEVLIIDIYNETDNLTHICKFDLATGDSTSLLTVSPLFDLHESCRSMLRPGWVLVSTFDYVGRLSDSKEDWLPFEDEVFALKMDGSGSVERYAHHHSREYSTYTPNRDSGAVYFAEPRATMSKSGNRILFASNWRLTMNEDFSVDCYLVDLRNMITGYSDVLTDKSKNVIRIYPNPIGDYLNIHYENGPLDGYIGIFDPIGKEVKSFPLNKDQAIFDLTDLQAGIYYFKIFDKNGANPKMGKIVKL